MTTTKYLMLNLAAMHSTCPSCIAPLKLRSELEVGEVAKVVCVNDQQKSESFWVEIVGLREGGYLGKVANDLEHIPLKLDDLIDIGYEHVQNVGKKTRQPGMLSHDDLVALNPVMRALLGLPKNVKITEDAAKAAPAAAPANRNLH